MLRRLIAMVLGATLLASCGGGPEPPGLGTISASPEGPGPGASIVDGLTVPEGTRLLGGVFPAVSTDGLEAKEHGSTALLLVTGDPFAALRQLVEQATRVGFGLHPLSYREPCWIAHEAPMWWSSEPQPVTSASADVAGLGCELAGTAERVGEVRGLLLRLYVGAEPYLAHLLVDDISLAEPVSDRADGAAVPAGPAPLQPRQLPVVPAAGGAITTFGLGESYRVVAASSLLAPPMPQECGSGGFVAALKASGPPDQVVDAYTKQFEQNRLRVVGSGSGHTPSGGRARWVSLATPGGGDAMVAALTAPGAATYLLVRRCGD